MDGGVCEHTTCDFMLDTLMGRAKWRIQTTVAVTVAITVTVAVMLTKDVSEEGLKAPSRWEDRQQKSPQRQRHPDQDVAVAADLSQRAS